MSIDFKKDKVPAFSPLAERLIQKRINATDKNQYVIIDHLAFSFPLSSLRHCHRAGFASKTSRTQTVFPLPPKVDCLEGKTIDQIQKHSEDIKQQLTSFYEKTLSVFINYVLGFDLSTPRDKGFHGYTNSLTIKTQNGVDVGFVGIGGQRDTVYIQLSGTGCKYLFSKISNFNLHHYLSTVLGVTHLARIDLAKDDFDDVYNCSYAEMAYKDGMFRTGKGGRMSVFKDASEYIYNADGQKVFDVEMITVGKRSSPIYWRNYNKKLEQKIKDESFSWFRSEAELKKWTVDAILDPDSVFAGINAFSQSISKTAGIRTKSMNKSKEACLELASRVRWFRHAAGKALNDILDITNGDIQKTIGLLLPDQYQEKSGKLGIPPTYKNLINHVLEC